MSNRDALLAAILANPDDDLPRLVWADCVEEEGDADRAEFVRVQVELAKHPRRLKTTEPFVLRSAGPNYWTTSSGGRIDGGMLIQCGKPGDRIDVEVYGEDTMKRKKGTILHGLRFLKFTGEDDEDAVLVRDAESVPDPVAELRRRARELRGRMVGVGNYELEKAIGIDGGWSYVWSRGFISSATCSWEDWQRHADSLVWWPEKTMRCPDCLKNCKTCKGKGCIPHLMPATAQPIEVVNLTTWPDWADGIVGNPRKTAVRIIGNLWPPVRKWNLPEGNSIGNPDGVER